MRQSCDTKERFLQTALDLFSVYGYKSVSVRDISQAVGTRESAMYRHFENKAALLKEITERAAIKLNDFRRKIAVNPKSAAKTTGEVFAEVYALYSEDDFMLRFRKFMMISRYESEEAAASYREMFLEKSMSYYENVFEQAIKEKGAEEDAKLLALELYAPLYFQIQRYDNPTVQEIEETKSILKAHAYRFFKRYDFLEGRHEN